MIFLLALLFAMGDHSSLLWAQSLSSPDGRLKFSYTIDPAKKAMLSYSVSYQNKAIIQPSQLGLNGWYENLEIDSTFDSSVNTEWRTVYGERAVVKDYYNQRTIVVKRKNSNARFWVIVRAYKEGIAFRYYFPEDPRGGGGYISIEEEKTSFAVPNNTQAWVAPFAQAAYQKLPVANWPSQSERPLTLELPNGLFASLGEASLVNFSRMKFYTPPGEKNIIRCALYGRVEDMGPYATPWRYIMVAENPGGLLQNNGFILNLNEPNKIAGTAWIKPGKVIRVNTFNTAFAKQVVDFAVARNLQYIHFDAGWYGKETFIGSDPRKVLPPELNMKEVVDYAKSKGIGVWLYVNQRALEKYFDEILPLYKQWGIAGIKFGFVLVGSQQWTTWLHAAVRKCADYGLMVDIHDEYRPTGYSRTYPNLLTQEGVRGNEEFPDGNTNTTLPFTRFIAGAADYTICYYSRRDLKPHLANAPENKVLKNTSGHQLALSLINYSPLQFLFWYDNPADYQGEPEIEFFDQLKTVWDDTKVINGEIGKYITIARRSGNKWFVGSITNNEARKISVPFDFLNKNKKYKLSLYTDDEKIKTRTKVAISRKTVNSATVLSLNVKPRGGFTMILEEL